MYQKMGRSVGPRRRRRIIFALALAVAMTFSAAALAATSRFSDVDTANTFLADIEWLTATGITRGCEPDEFCPKKNVTREQMAAFLHRLATGRIVDASTVQGLTPAELRGQTGPQGLPGPAGLAGATGPAGSTGATGVVGFATVESDLVTVAAGGSTSASAPCATGDLVTGGGFLRSHDLLVVTASHPSASDTWTVEVVNRSSSTSLSITAYARCIDVTP